MYRRILETDEAIRDLSHISYEAYKYTGDKNSGFIFLKLYDVTIENMAVFTEGFSKTGIEYRGYVIHILPFGNYNLFYVDDGKKGIITVLRILYQKQDWQRILKVNDTYHVHGKDIGE